MMQLTNAEIARFISKDQSYVDYLEKEEKAYYRVLKYGALCMLLDLDEEDIEAMYHLRKSESTQTAQASV